MYQVIYKDPADGGVYVTVADSEDFDDKIDVAKHISEQFAEGMLDEFNLVIDPELVEVRRLHFEDVEDTEDCD